MCLPVAGCAVLVFACGWFAVFCTEQKVWYIIDGNCCEAERSC